MLMAAMPSMARNLVILFMVYPFVSGKTYLRGKMNHSKEIPVLEVKSIKISNKMEMLSDVGIPVSVSAVHQEAKMDWLQAPGRLAKAGVSAIASVLTYESVEPRLILKHSEGWSLGRSKYPWGVSRESE